MIGFLFIGAGLILLIAYFYQQKKQNGGKSSSAKKLDLKGIKNASLGNKSNEEKEKPSYTKNGKNDIPKKDLFEFMEFEKIQDDMIIQDKNSKFTMVLQCKGINYDLMSEVEQLAVEEGFITFLNTLTTPIQLYVQARAIDLKTSLDMYKGRVNEFNREYEEKSEEYNRLANSMNTTEEELAAAQMEKEKMYNISEYAHDITRYVEKLSLNKHMLQRKFYVVLSYYKSEISTSTKFSEEELFDICYRELYTRAQGVISALQTCSVSAKVMDSNDLAELIYITYNRDDQKLLDIRTALESGFYRMYSTTKDVHEKRNELIKKQIQEEAMNRLEKAIKLAIDEGRITDPDQKIEDFEDDVDRTAILMSEEVDMPQDIRDSVQEIIVKGHQKAAAERKKERQKRIEEAEIQEEKISDNHEKEKISEYKVEEKSEPEIDKKEKIEEVQNDEEIEIIKDDNANDSENDSIV